jgi:hypothetical protein
VYVETVSFIFVAHGYSIPAVLFVEKTVLFSLKYFFYLGLYWFSKKLLQEKRYLLFYNHSFCRARFPYVKLFYYFGLLVGA